MKKFTQEDLDKILGDLHQGPIGHRKEHHWDSRYRLQGQSNPTYGQGALYKEITTGFTGNFTEMKNQFPGFTLQFIKREQIKKNSLYPNHKWIKLTDDRVKGRDLVIRFTPTQVKNIKQVYLEDTSLNISDLADKFKSHSIEIRSILNKKGKYNSDKYGPAVEIRKSPILTCPHCKQVISSSANYNRWHGDKCKESPDYIKPILKPRPSATVYRELTTGFQGTCGQMYEKFGVDAGALSRSSSNDKPLAKGKGKGLQFKKI